MRKITKTALIALLLPAAILLSLTPASASPLLTPAPTPVSASPPLTSASTPGSFRNLAATAALLADVDSGMILFENKADRMHPADELTKVMTLLLAISACEVGAIDLYTEVEMTESAYYNINASSSTMNIQPGESMTLIDLMYCAILGKANEACNLLAEFVSGSVGAFVSVMNTRAKELGCDDTHFTNAHGQYNENQYTTAKDQFVIYREAMNHPLFVEITGSFRYDTESTNESDPRRMMNSNELVNPNSKYYFSSCTSGAASATYEGGYSSVSFADSNDMSLICVVLGSDALVLEDESVDMRNLSEARRLMEWGFSTYSWRTVLSSTDLICKAPVTHGAGADFVNLHPESSITLLLRNDTPEDYFEKQYKVYSVDNDDTLYAPVNAGDVLGEVMVVSRSGEEYGPVLLLAKTDVELHKLQFIKMQLGEMLSSPTAHKIMWGLALLVAGYLALVIRYNVLRRRRLQRIAEAKRRLIEERQGVQEEQDRDFRDYRDQRNH